MARKSTVPKPTNAEFKILSVIWDRQSATVREVLNHLKQFEDIGYTTVLKVMQIMTEKGLLKRNRQHPSQIWRQNRAEIFNKSNTSAGLLWL
jgi:predicted transcriptional regulator